MIEEKKFYIYLHIKLTNGEPFYIGRGTGNRYKARDNRNQWWRNIVKKYDYDTIFLEENLTHDEANIKETYWINRIGRRDLDLGPLVNMTNGGDGLRGQVFTKEHREKMSLAKLGKPSLKKGKPISQSQLDKMIGQKRTQQTKDKLRESHLGQKGHWKDKQFTDEHKQKLSEKKKGKDPINKTYYKIEQFNLSGDFIREWENQYIAANELNLKADGIRRACIGLNKTSQGFIWKQKI